jgi:hypothetical protein
MAEKKVCGHFMPRADTKCRLLAGHRGCHRARVWYCDGCGKPQAGFPAVRSEEYGDHCFMCCLPERKYWGLIPARKQA